MDYSEKKEVEKTSSDEIIIPNSSTSDNGSLDLSNRTFLPEYTDEYNPDGYIVATEEDRLKYKNVMATLSYSIFLICVVEFAERGSYYGVQGCLANFIQRPLPAGGNGWGAPPKGSQLSAGALDLGLQASNGVTTMLQFLAYTTPLLGGYLADTKMDKFKAVMIGAWIGAISHVILVIAAIPSVLDKGHAALAPTVIAIVLLAVGTGFIKPNLLPLLLDQYPYKTNVLKRVEDGSYVYVNRDSSLERVTLIFYWSINVGAFLQLATSYCEKRVGFWLAFLVPGIMYALVPLVLIMVNKHIVKQVPQGSILDKVFAVLKVSFRGNWVKRAYAKEFFTYASPSAMNERGEYFSNEKTQKPISWTDKDVRDIARTFICCFMFLYWIFFNLNDTGLGSTLTSQAGSMVTNGVPNDLFNNFNQITIIVLLPILDRGVYPILRRFNINFRTEWKISFGFLLGAISSMVAAIIQHQIYTSSPCGYYSTDCAEVAPISAWREVAVYIFQAAGECFCYTTAYEVAYTRAPKHMKGLVMALFLFTSAISSAISLAVTAALVDPWLIYPFGALAIAGFLTAVVFPIQYWRLDLTMQQEAIADGLADDEEDYENSLSPKASRNSHEIAAEMASIYETRR
ncbi:hypothetical protein BVG19_g5080 [[Candida] boidinii]|nr:hypothetical protein BVG19_g5080 [[Candida] boidinii]OWB53654.1 hypothetical protein B5S27_g5260 [[Candida] boidinii]